MACFSKDCDFVKKNGDCFYDGVPPSNSPKTCEKCNFFKPITKYDLLVRKTPEEMAEWFYSLSVCPPKSSACPSNDNCVECWLNWLKQEVEE